MPRIAYQNDTMYSNGVKTVLLKYKDGNTISYVENGERKSIGKWAWHNWGMKPLEPLISLNTRAKATITKKQYRAGNEALFIKK